MSILKSSGTHLHSSGVVLSSVIAFQPPLPPPPDPPPSPEIELVGTSGATDFGIHDMSDSQAIG